MLSTFASSLPPKTTTEAEALFSRFYGRSGHAVALPGERDQNFHIHTDTEDFVLKLHHPDEDPAGLDFQTAALRHLEGLPVPRVISTVEGVDIQLLPDGRRLRMLSWVEGVLLKDVAMDDPLRRRIGKTLGELDQALMNFAPSAPQTPLLWDIQHISAVRPLMVHLWEPDIRRLAEARLDHWESKCAPLQAELPWQVIHNDANPGNVLMQKDSLGLLDFGDIVRAPRVQEIAVACSYYLGDTRLEAMRQLAGGYDEVLPLLPEEWEILPEMIGMRAVASITIGAWRVQLLGEDRTSYLRSYATSCATLRWLEANPDAGRRSRNP